MSEVQVPDDVRRFLLSGVLTVPHVEAILQLRAERNRAWDADRLATRLYVRAGVAQQVLADLNAIGIAAAEGQPPTYRYAPGTAELADLLDRLVTAYSTHLVAVTAIIHRAEPRKALLFAEAFRIRKDSR